MNHLLLEYVMKLKNKSAAEMSEKMHIDRATFYRKKVGRSDFDRAEIQILKNELDLTPEQVDEIFFAD